MKAEIFGIYNGVNESSFTDEKSGNVIPYRTVTLLDDDGSYTLNCSVDKNVNLDMLERFHPYTFLCNLYNGKRPKIYGVKMDSVKDGK